MATERKALPAIDTDRCTGCAQCAVKCPFDAIAMVRIPEYATTR